MENTEFLRCQIANYFVNCLHLTGSIVLESPKLIDIFQGLIWKLCKDIAGSNDNEKELNDVKPLIVSILNGFEYDNKNYESPLRFKNIDFSDNEDKEDNEVVENSKNSNIDINDIRDKEVVTISKNSNINLHDKVDKEVVRELILSVNQFFGYLLKRNEEIKKYYESLSEAKNKAFKIYDDSATFEFEKLTDKQM